MAHQLKYYKEIESHGHLWRVEILQDTEDTLTPMEIGPVLQGLRLIVQGDQADVDTPIVKTSMEMVFVDAPDLEEDRKCGYWEEFYTSSATEYQVKLYKDSALEWTGYVTPDSFSEDLRYRGSVTIIARDNLGHLQDYECRALEWANSQGRVKISTIISKAMSLGIIGMDWSYDQRDLSRVTLSNEWGDGGDLWSQMIDATVLSELNMYEALEKSLYSIGATMRYIGGNSFKVSMIRNVGLAGNSFWADVPRGEVMFLAYGHRELSPAVRQIEEVIEFNLEKGSTAFSMQVRQYLDEGQIDQVIGIGGNSQYSIPVHGYANDSMGQFIGAANSMLLDISRYERKSEYAQERFGQWNDPSVLYVAMNTQRPVRLMTRIFDDGGISATCRCRIDHPITFLDQAHSVIGNMPLSNTYVDYTNTATFRITFTPIGTLDTRYYDISTKTWSNSDKTFVRAVFDRWRTKVLPYVFYEATDIEVTGIPIDEPGDLVFELVQVYGDALYTQTTCYGAYARLSGMQIEHIRESDDASKLTIRTEYSEKNNVKLTRGPEFAPNSTAKYSPHYYKKGLVTLGNDMLYHTGEQWKWNDTQVGQPLGVLIHQQLLAYYAKPNNVLTGELSNKTGDFPDFRSLWMWNGKTHLLTSGALNILTGRMENAVLREFTRYDHMWETWVENEDKQHDYPAGIVILRAHPARELTEDDVRDLPSWLTIRSIRGIDATGKQLIVLAIMENATGNERQAIIRVDTAWARITQRAAGDYNADYSPDYS